MTPIEQAAQALRWYEDEAKALAKNTSSRGYGHEHAVLASVSVLSLDGGRRAKAALVSLEAAKQQEPPEFVLLPRNPRRLSNEQIQVLLRLENGRVAIFHAWEEIVALAAAPSPGSGT